MGGINGMGTLSAPMDEVDEVTVDAAAALL
jgi:hypothetical protein